jgi:hypothetical protein
MKTYHLAAFLSAFFLLFLVACKKSDAPGNGNTPPPPPPPPPTVDSIYNPVDPTLALTQGFFLQDWQAKTFTAPSTVAGTVATASPDLTLYINVNKVITKVPRYVFGNNSNLWTGQYVTQPSLMGYIKDLGPNIIRAPAGSVSDVYFWNGTDANPAPADVPGPVTNYWYGGNTASWTFSLDNYYNLLSQTNSTGIITINYGYARYGTGPTPVATAAHLAADWVRHDNGRTKFWEIGNETYGNWEAGYQIDTLQNKDHQPMLITGDLYGRHVQVFADSMRAAALQIGATIYIGATLYDSPPYGGAYNSIVTWNQGVLTQAGSTADFFIIHDYFTAYNTNSSISDILNTGATVPASAMTYVKQQLAQYSVPQKPVALTEWNIRAVGSRQDISYIAGVHAAKALGAIIKDQYGEASRWDLANGWGDSKTPPVVAGDDQGLFSLGQPGVPDGTPRPAFFYQYYFQKFFGDRMVSDSVSTTGPDIATYSSTFYSGQAGTIIVNSSAFTQIVGINFQHWPAGSKYYWYVLTGGTDNGQFSGQVYVNGTGPSPTISAGGPLNYSTLQAYSAPLTGTIKVTVPPYGVVYLVADKK